ncbi:MULTISPECIES: hypothetical protein [Kytococcus]|uniref:DUF4244 domain-containing protein n=1 Tax=Kytococcus schroeteri TaxID=138300 RepID=A0A2I1PC34_9MICO|nr:MULTISPECIES: hypothetical protein [Kytococcus]OFS14355.1 hypothetical protein HMPREF3099_04260 [Kytococcus sp. HMSC28H12]PKZ42199.1 hypothetical protein CYJ76_03915 [Kytococcus schroeteri]
MQNKIQRFVQPRIEGMRAANEKGMAVAEYAIGIFVIAAVVLLGMNMMKDLVPTLMGEVIKAAFDAFK